MKLSNRGQSTNIENHNVGQSPDQTSLNVARNNLLHHMTYNRSRELLNYSGCPDEAYPSGRQINGNFDCTFHIIFPTVGTGSDKVRIGYKLTTWDNNTAGNCEFKWSGVASDNLPNNSVAASNNQTTSMGLAAGAKPSGLSVPDSKEFDYDEGSIGNYSLVTVSFKHLQPASFVSWIMPQFESDYNAIDSTTESQAFYLSDSTFNIGQVLRGSNAIADINGSVGTLCQRQFADGTGDQNMISNSDLCLFQWGHPSGTLVLGSTGSLVDENLFGFNIKIKGRELLTADSGKLNVVLVYRADAGTSIKMLVDSTGVTHTYALSTWTNPDPIRWQVFTDIAFDGSSDELTFYCNVSSALGVEVRTVAVFESTY